MRKKNKLSFWFHWLKIKKIIKIFAGKDSQGLPLMDQEWLDSKKEGLDSFDDKPETAA
mgnify:CR=1 FL=1